MSRRSSARSAAVSFSCFTRWSRSGCAEPENTRSTKSLTSRATHLMAWPGRRVDVGPLVAAAGEVALRRQDAHQCHHGGVGHFPAAAERVVNVADGGPPRSQTTSIIASSRGVSFCRVITTNHLGLSS